MSSPPLSPNPNPPSSPIPIPPPSSSSSLSSLSTSPLCYPVLSSSSSPPPGEPSLGRSISRKALLTVGARAAAIANSSSVMKFSINTALKLTPSTVKSFTVNQLYNYGNPLIDAVDRKLDETIDVIEGIQSVAYSYSNTNNGNEQINDDSNDPFVVDEMNSSSSPIPIPSTALTSSSTEITSLSPPSPTPSALYSLYWDHLKDKFVQSRWYGAVDEILLQNALVKSFTANVIKPADCFFNTITEEFVSHGGNQEEFLFSLQQRVGSAWDDRLAPLARGFYSTARAVSALVGAGKFVGGALQLGKAKVSTAIDDLMYQWDKVLGLTDEMMEKLLPDQETTQLLIEHKEQEQHHKKREEEEQQLIHGNHQETEQSISSSLSDSENDEDDSMTHNSDDEDIALSTDGEYDYSSNEESQSTGDNINTSFSSFTSPSPLPASVTAASKKRPSSHLSSSCTELSPLSYDQLEEADPSAQQLILAPSNEQPGNSLSGRILVTKFGKRLRQRIPPIPTIRHVKENLNEWGEQLKSTLTHQQWFQSVDEILIENPLVKAFATFVRPAEHFFDTALHLFQTRMSNSQNNTDTSHNHNNNQNTTEGENREDTQTMEKKEEKNNENMDNSALLSSDSVSVSDSPLHSSRSVPLGRLAPASLSSTVSMERDSSTPATSSSRLHSPSSSSSFTPPDSSSSLVLNDFLENLRIALGSSWDDRLINEAKTFFSTAQQQMSATETMITMQENNNNTQQMHITSV